MDRILSPKLALQINADVGQIQAHPTFDVELKHSLKIVQNWDGKIWTKVARILTNCHPIFAQFVSLRFQHAIANFITNIQRAVVKKPSTKSVSS